MSDKSTSKESEHLSTDKNAKSTERADNSEQDKQKESAASVKKGSLIILLLIVTSLTWYLVADRFSPYTTQARVQGYVVGVAPKVAGLVKQVHVKNNQEIKVGQLLFEIDTSQYQIALDRANSDLENAKNQVSAGNAGVESARANLVAAQANELKARQDLSRLKRLHNEDPGTISVRRIEVSQATLKQSTASVVAAKAAIEQAIEQKGGTDDENNAILKSAQSAVAQAELDLSNTKVIAETSGVITDLSAEIGQYAKAGNPILTLIAIQDVWINAEYTENNLGHIHEGSPVEILFDVLPGQIFKGTVRSIGLGISAGNPPQPGTLPTIENNRDWLRQAQRFPVIINLDVTNQPVLRSHIRVGGQASVIVYVEDYDFIRMLGEFYIRLMSWLSYAY